MFWLNNEKDLYGAYVSDNEGENAEDSREYRGQ
jgi:hypothetical protein